MIFMAVIQVKKYKTIKDENGNNIQVPKTPEEWNKETRNGTKTWYFSTRYEINGKKKQYKSKLFALKREAQDDERLFLNNPIEYIRNNSKRAKDALEFTVKDNCIKSKILDEYYDEYFLYDLKINKESTAYDHKTNYYKHVSPILGNFTPSEIDIAAIDKFHAQIESKQLAYSTNVNINSSLSGLLEFLKQKKGIISINYAKAYGSFKKPSDEIIPIEKKIKYQTIEEFNFFMKYIKNDFWYTFFNFLFWHGLRKGEQQALRWSDIDFEHETVSITKTVGKSKSGGVKITNTKNKKNRIIFLASQSVECLKLLYNKMSLLDGFNNEWFVFGRGKEKDEILARNTIDRNLKKFYVDLRKQNSDKKIRILTHHEFGRHSHASYLLNKGMGKIDIYFIIAQRLGDTEKVIRETYAHPYENVNNDKTKELLKL